MRSLPCFALAVALAACGGTTSNVDGGADAQADVAADGRNPCDGLGCPVGEGPVTLRPQDAVTKAVVASPAFAEGGKTLTATCMSVGGLDGGACDAWRMPTLGFGPHTITVSAPGYDDAKITVQVSGPSGCCGLGPAVDETVAMVASNPEARCLATGGAVGDGLCCANSPDFPDGCSVGACSCSPQNSVTIKRCLCAKGQCFDPKVGCK
jgi:hypothetical protein